MNPARVRRDHLEHLTDLPNVGPSIAADYVALGYATPAALTGVDPWLLYQQRCVQTGTRQDPCLLDVFLSVAAFLAGGAARPWWDYTRERKARFATPMGRESARGAVAGVAAALAKSPRRPISKGRPGRRQ